MRAITSASNIHRRALCPGSERMEAGLEEENSEQSKEGQLLHAYDANPQLDRAFLKTFQVDLLEISGKLDEAIFKRVREQFVIPEDEPFEEGRERELKALGESENETPGHCDRYRYWPARKVLAIIDKKFGYKVVTPAGANYQLRVYAIGGYEEWDVEQCVVAITQPRLSYEERITMAAYSWDDIELSTTELIGIRKGSRQENAPLVAGEEQCRYCKARTSCPAFKEAMNKGLAVIKIDGSDISKELRDEQIARSISAATDDQVGQVLNSLQFAGFISDIVRDEARKRIAEDPEAGARMGWKLGKEIDKRNIVNIPRAIALLRLAGILTNEEILNCSKPSLTKLQEQYREKRKITHKKARELIDETLEGVVILEAEKPKLLRL